jgi:putative membrane protein (TIGR04086 family)
MKYFRAIRLRSILLGLVCFAILYFGFTLLARLMVRDLSHIETRLVWFNTAAYFIWIICGFIAAAAARHSGTLHGFIFGALSIVVVAIAQVVFGGVSALIHFFSIGWFFIVTALGCLGGFAWDVWNRLKITASNQRLHRIANKPGSR